jgi:hypothetical protein
MGLVGTAALALLHESRIETARAHVEQSSTSSQCSNLMTVEEYLAGYWGSRWSELRSRIPESERTILEHHIDPAHVPSWDVVAPLVRLQIREQFQAQRERWVSDLRDRGRVEDLDVLTLRPATDELSRAELSEVERIIDSFAPSLEALANLAFDLTAEAEDSLWESGHYSATPFVSFADDSFRERFGQNTIAQSYVYSPWMVSYTLDSSDYPKLEDTLLRILGLRQQRRKEVLLYIEYVSRGGSYRSVQPLVDNPTTSGEKE